MVRLKVDVLEREYSFKFDFNSSMVRLKVGKFQGLLLCLLFQFLYGAIKRNVKNIK